MEIEQKRRIQADFDRQKSLAAIGAQLESVQNGKVEISCPRPTVPERFGDGLFSGSVTMPLVEAACVYAALSAFPEENQILSVSFHGRTQHPEHTDGLLASARISGHIRDHGRTLVMTECTVSDQHTGKAFAKVTATITFEKNPVKTADTRSRRPKGCPQGA